MTSSNAPHGEVRGRHSPLSLQKQDMGGISRSLQLELDDLLGDLRHARRRADLGRLAWLTYCEVRRWARMAGDEELAARSSAMITSAPAANREEFLAQVDDLIDELAKALH